MCAPWPMGALGASGGATGAVVGTAGGTCSVVVTCTVGGTCMGTSASFAVSGATVEVWACIGASANFATMGVAAGSDADSGLLTTRRLVRVVEGATAADNADGESGVTPLDCRLMVEVVGAGFSAGRSLRILSTVFSVTGFSLSERSRIGDTLGCSVMFGSTCAAGA